MCDRYHRYILSKYCNKRKYLRANPFKNKVSVHMRTPKFFQVYAFVCANIKAFVEPWMVPLSKVPGVSL